jgi:WD40 repeat protein
VPPSRRKWTRFLGWTALGLIIVAVGSMVVLFWLAKVQPDFPLHATIHGHKAYVNALAYSPSGKLFASGDDQGMIVLWDGDSLGPLFRLAGHRATVMSLAFSDGDRILASSAADGNVRFWETSTGNSKASLQLSRSSVVFVCFLPNRRTLLAQDSEGSVFLCDIDKTEVVGQFSTASPGDFPHCALAENGTLFTAGFGNDSPSAWNPLEGKRLQEFEAFLRPTMFSTLEVSSKGLLATGAWEGTVALWDPQGGKLKHVLRERGNLVESLAFSPDGKLCAVGEGKTQSLPSWSEVVVWELTGLSEVGRVRRQWDGIRRLRFSPDGKFLAGATGRNVCFWQVAGTE